MWLLDRISKNHFLDKLELKFEGNNYIILPKNSENPKFMSEIITY